MSRVKSKGNRSTERKLRATLAAHHISGWETNPKNIIGVPDILFRKKRLAIFIDGCFWHGCPTCYRRPKSKRKFWDTKLAENMARDRKVITLLRKQGWKVLRYFECELNKHPDKVIETISTILAKK